MTDKEFYKLHCELDGVYLKLNYLQEKYRKETGRSFIFGQGYIKRGDTDKPKRRTLKRRYRRNESTD